MICFLFLFSSHDSRYLLFLCLTLIYRASFLAWWENEIRANLGKKKCWNLTLKVVSLRIAGRWSSQDCRGRPQFAIGFNLSNWVAPIWVAGRSRRLVVRFLEIIVVIWSFSSMKPHRNMAWGLGTTSEQVPSQSSVPPVSMEMTELLSGFRVAVGGIRANLARNVSVLRRRALSTIQSSWSSLVGRGTQTLHTSQCREKAFQQHI